MAMIRSRRGRHRPAPPSVRARFVPRLVALEDRTVPSVVAEAEPNDSAAAAQAVTVPVLDVLSARPEDRLTINANFTAGDADFFRFTINQRSGVFFDIDARETGLSPNFDSVLTLLNANGGSLGGALGGGGPGGGNLGGNLGGGIGSNNFTNDDGYDFDGYPAPTRPVPTAANGDSSLYMDLDPGTYTIQVSGKNGTTGAYQ